MVGIGGGLVAYYSYSRQAGASAGLPTELRYVPADAQLVAYADVHSVMGSDMRRELERMATGPGRGQQQMHEFAGIDLEKDINHIVAYLQPELPDPSSSRPPNALILAQGKFDQAAVEKFVADHGGSIEDYNGKRIMVRLMPRRPGGRGRGAPPMPMPETQQPPEPPQPRPPDQAAIAFVRPDLIAVGPIDLVRRALDNSAAAASITTNADLMHLMRDASSGNAWVVGRFDAVSRRIGIPPNLREQVPPVRLISASARVDGGVKAVIKAETADKAAADQLRDVVRAAISFVRLQGGSKPELQDVLKSIDLAGSGNDVQLSFQLTPDALRALTPQRPPRPDQPLWPDQPLPPAPPPPPAPPSKP